MTEHIILNHPRGKVFITIGSVDDALVRHVIKKIEAVFDIKKEATMEDLFKGFFGDKK